VTELAEVLEILENRKERSDLVPSEHLVLFISLLN